MAQDVRRAAAALVAAVVISIGCVPHARAAGDAENGRNLAQRWCAACHVVAPGQREATEAAPTFAEIARRPRFNADALAFFLLDPHPKMPNMSLTRREAADLAAYIATLSETR